MNRFNSPLATREGNVITIHSLQNYNCVNSFIRALHKGYKNAGYEEFVVQFKDIQGIFPNAAVPIAGLIDFFRKENNLVIEGKSYNENLQAILSPYELPDRQDALQRALGKIWKFQTSKDIYEIQTALINELRRNDIFADGVLEGIEWSINEIMDNVLNHSQASCGFIMGQIHKSTKHVAFTIYDTGIGIYNSLKGSINSPRNNADALTLCIKEGVTRDKKVGQGNGMYGLFSLIREGNGRLVITSGRDAYQYIDGIPSITKDVHIYPSNERWSTTIDFQLDYSQDISIKKVLTFNGKVFDFTNLYAENLENDAGELVFKISELAEGTGTRESAQRLKNEIINLMKTNKQTAILDFSNIDVVTSSFIDELVAKLLVDLGLFQFNRYIKLANMSNTLQQTLQKSVIQRIIEEYK